MFPPDYSSYMPDVPPKLSKKDMDYAERLLAQRYGD